MRRIALAAALFSSLAGLGGCGGGSAGDRPRAVVIGIDSADWRVIDPLIAAGRMPHLTALRERGISGPIQTLVDYPLSPVIWTSVATGVTPAKHGITWFLVDRPDGTRVPVRRPQPPGEGPVEHPGRAGAARHRGGCAGRRPRSRCARSRGSRAHRRRSRPRPRPRPDSSL